MSLPAFATVAELELRIPGGIAEDDTARADAALFDASALIRAEAGKTWVNSDNELDGVPDAVFAVTIAVARRVMVNPDGVASESQEDYSRSYAPQSTSADVYLTKGERRVVQRAAGRTGLWTLSTTRSDVAGDVPAIVTPYGFSGDSTEELDPYSEGWPG